MAGSPEGRLRELEAQVSELTDLVDALRRVVQLGTSDVRIVGSRSLTLVQRPTHLALKFGKIIVNNGFAEKSFF